MTNSLPRLGLHIRSLLATVVSLHLSELWSQLLVLGLEELTLRQKDFSVVHGSYLAVALGRVQHDCLIDLVVRVERQLFLVRRAKELFEWIFVLCLGPMAR